MSTTTDFRAAIEVGDAAKAVALFAPDARFYSPVKFTPSIGHELIGPLFTILLEEFSDFRYVGELHGNAERTSGEATAATNILVFRAEVGGKQVHGIDMIQLDDNGKIAEFTVMIRPASALAALGQAVEERLAATSLTATTNR